MTRIAYVSHLDLNLYGFRLQWMRALLANGCEVCAVVPDGEYGAALRQEGIRVVPYPLVRRSLNPFSGLATLRGLHQIFKREHFDLAHSFTLKPNLYSSLAGALTRTPVPGADLAVIAGAGHVVNLARPPEFNAALEAFFERAVTE